jgi:Mn-dependent DtxR family transcriptional regulator
MSVLGTARSLEHDYLHVLYELAGRAAKSAVSYNEVRMELGRSDKEVEQASDFWADRGVVEWTGIGHVALTRVGLRRAERLAGRGWSFSPF